MTPHCDPEVWKLPVQFPAPESRRRIVTLRGEGPRLEAALMPWWSLTSESVKTQKVKTSGGNEVLLTEIKLLDAKLTSHRPQPSLS